MRALAYKPRRGRGKRARPCPAYSKFLPRKSGRSHTSAAGVYAQIQIATLNGNKPNRPEKRCKGVCPLQRPLHHHILPRHVSRRGPREDPCRKSQRSHGASEIDGWWAQGTCPCFLRVVPEGEESESPQRDASTQRHFSANYNAVTGL